MSNFLGTVMFDTASLMVYPIGLGITASLNGTASYSLTSISASYVPNLYPVVTVPSASWASQSLSSSFASTASNFNGQTISASNFYVSNSLVLDTAYLQLNTTTIAPTFNISSSYLYVSASANTDSGVDLYVNQSGSLTKFRWLTSGISSGLLYGGLLSISQSNVLVTPGAGLLINYNPSYTKENNPIINKVTWNAITQSLLYLATSQETFLSIDANGNLVQQTNNFTPQQQTSSITLGRLGHANYTTVTAINGITQPTYNQTSQISTFIKAFGPLKLSGMILSSNGTSLQFGLSSGQAYIYGGFYSTTPDFPSVYNTPTVATASMLRSYRSSSVGYYFDNNNGAFYTAIDPTHWDNGSGVLQTVGSGNWTVQRVYYNPSSNKCCVYYGQELYSTLTNAVAGFNTDTFSEGTNTMVSFVLVAYLILRGNTTNLSDTANNQIISAGIFRNLASAGGATPAYALGDLSNVLLTTPIAGNLLEYNGTNWINTNSANITGSLLGTASLATTASYVKPTSFIPNIITATSNYALLSSDYTVIMSGSSTLSASLPSATVNNGQVYNIKNVSPYVVTLTGSNLIDNSYNWIINQWSSITVQSNGTQYYII